MLKLKLNRFAKARVSHLVIALGLAGAAQAHQGADVLDIAASRSQTQAQVNLQKSFVLPDGRVASLWAKSARVRGKFRNYQGVYAQIDREVFAVSAMGSQAHALLVDFCHNDENLEGNGNVAVKPHYASAIQTAFYAPCFDSKIIKVDAILERAEVLSPKQSCDISTLVEAISCDDG